MQAVLSFLTSTRNRTGLIVTALAFIEIGILLLGPDVAAARAKIAASPDDVPWEADADLGLHLGALINLVLLVVLAVTSRWWSRGFSDKESLPEESQAKAKSTASWFWPLVLVAVVIGTGLRLPLASRSLWWDECWVMRQCSHGSWKPDKKNPGELSFSPTTWKRCAFYYQKPTNHVPMSLAQKASLTTWRTFTGSSPHEFSDLAARVPALLVSAAAVALIAGLLRRWGRPGVGVVAAWILALHPWHIRYGVDARGYSLVVPLCLSALLAGSCLLGSQGRKLRYWVWLGLNQFLWLWAFPNALLDVGIMFAILGWLLFRQQTCATDRWAIIARLMVSHLFAAMLLLQAFLPNFMQAKRWAGQEADAHYFDQTLLLETLSQAVTGAPWEITENSPAAEGKSTSSAKALSGTDVTRLLLFPLLAVGFLGLWAVSFDRGGHHWLLYGIVLSTSAFMLLTRVAESYFYPRFAMALLIPVVIGLAMCCRDLWGRSSALQRILAAGPVLAAFLLASQPARSALLSLPYTGYRDVADFLRAQPGNPRVACFGLGREALPVYFPNFTGVVKPADIQAELDKARAEKRDLFLVQGYDSFHRTVVPDGFKLIDDPSLFEKVRDFPGIETQFLFHVFKAR
jgi:hypothetical protein